MVVHEVPVLGGRTLEVADTGPGPEATLVWHHGSPHTGAALPPLLEAARAHGRRLVTYARPSYGGSSPSPGRDVASAASDVAAIADALDLGPFAVLGASGGGPHALACAAVLHEQVTGVVTFASLTPYEDDDAWFAGMRSDAALRAAAAGRPERAQLAEVEEFDPEVFTAADLAALGGPWASLGEDAGRADAAGPDGLVDDDVAFTRPWGVDLTTITAPVLLVHGEQDRMVPASHALRLTALVPRAELWLLPGEGHVSVLRRLDDALDWLASRPA